MYIKRQKKIFQMQGNFSIKSNDSSELTFLERQFEEMKINNSSDLFKIFSTQQKRLKSSEENYLKFKCQNFRFILQEDDLLNALKRISVQKKTSHATKIKIIVENFIEYFFTDEEIDKMFFSIFFNRKERILGENYNHKQKKSLIEESLYELLLN